MSPTLLLIAYGITIVASAMLGGYLPQIIRMNHVRMQLVLSFVGGMMLGVSVFLLLPHGFAEIHEHAIETQIADAKATSPNAGTLTTAGFLRTAIDSIDYAMIAMVVGLMFTFFMMRAFHFHQHAVGDDDAEHGGHAHDGHAHDGHENCSHDHSEEWRPTKLGWLGVIFGLGLHTFMDGIALGAAVLHESHHSHSGAIAPAGFGVYLAIFLHKPLDALSLSTLMAAENRSWRSIQLANACFGLMCLVGALAAVYWPPLASGGFWLGCLLSASAGVFLCISLSDLLPEVQFHRHDRLQLSAAMLIGIGISLIIEIFHQH